MKRPQDMTPRERYNAILADACETMLILLKIRIGQLEEMPAEERESYRDFCDSTLIIIHSFMMGAPDIEAIEALNGKIRREGAAKHGKGERSAGRLHGSATGRAIKP